MKKISIIIMVLVVALASCKKTPEVNLKYVDVERDLVMVGTTTANIQCDYAYITTLKKAYLYYGEGESETNMTSAEMRVVQNTLYVELTGLKENTDYRYYYEFHNGFNSMRTALKSFRTEAGNSGGEEPPTPEITLPTVITAEVTEISTNSAQCGGVVTNDGGSEVTERGICWSINENPNVNDIHIAAGSGMGAFTVSMDGLEANTTYHVRAYAINEAGTAYGLDKEFTTLSGGGGGGPTQDEYFTIESLDDDNTITLNIPSEVNSQCLTSVSYSTDGTTWTTLNIDATDQTISVTLNRGGTIRYKGLGRQYAKDYQVYSYFTSSGNINVFGNIMSLIYGDDFANTTAFPTGSSYTFDGLFRGTNKLISAGNLILPATSLVYECYRNMFYECTSLTEAPVLPATILAYGCYMGMFGSCTSLTEAPVLLTTTLAVSCYYGMFYECTSLTEAPALPATTLAERCYRYMFYGCTSLTEPPVLPANILAIGCYEEMFRQCTSLTKAPALPAATLADWCYSSMFEGTSLTEAPVLPATTLADYCYASMFRGTSLTEAPVLPATTLANHCYHDMFWDCTSLTEAPILPATTLADYCYANMFRACTSLTEAPALPATNLAECCYGSMFYSCTVLTTPPVLPATSLAEYCYYNMFSECTSMTEAPMLPAVLLSASCYEEMFRGCVSLREVTCLATNISATDCTKNWLSRVSSVGTFHKNAAMNDWPLNSDSGIPSGWNVVDY